MNKRKSADNETCSDAILKRAKISLKEPVKENVIRYGLFPSLEHLSAAKVIITLWSQKNIQDEIKKICAKRSINCRLCKRVEEYSNLTQFWKELEDKILNIVIKLSQFDIITKILLDRVHPIGQEIFDWIAYQDKHVFYVTHCRYENVAVNYLDCIVWTSRGIINYEQTARALLATGGLHDIEKYHLACTYCFEDEMAVITPILTGKIRCFVSSKFYGQKAMVYFWSAHLTSDFTRLNEEFCYYNTKYITNYSINECMFRLLACEHRNNQKAIKFMWNMLSDDEKSRQILTIIKYSKTDLKCFFLSQMNEVQQKAAFRAESKSMLLCLVDDWLWKDYFLPTMYYVLDVIPALDFLLVLEDIVKCRMEKCFEMVDEYNRYTGILKVLWRSASADLKNSIFEFKNGKRCCGIIFSLLCERNKDMIQLILSDMSDLQKQTMVYSCRSNLDKCYWLIINQQIDVVKSFIDNTLSSERFKDHFKHLLVKSYGIDIAVHFERNREIDKLEGFIKWVFKSHHDIAQFLEKLAHSQIVDDILDDALELDEEEYFLWLDQFFTWCGRIGWGTTSEFRIKRQMYEKNFTKFICKFAEQDNYEMLEQFFDWCISDSDSKLVQHTFHENHDSVQLIQLVLKLVKKNDQLQSLEEFSRWCFVKQRKISAFKTWVLRYYSEDTVGVCIELLSEGMFELADEFVIWCCKYPKSKISEFKNELMLRDNVRNLFTRYKSDEKMLENVIKWFNPPATIIIQFRRKFINFHWLKYVDIAAHLIKNEKWEEVRQFIELTFNSDEDKKKFKEKLAYGKVSDDILESIVVHCNEDSFVKLEDFFLWCASGNAFRAFELKEKMHKKYFTKLICKLMEEDKYQLLEQFLNWSYQNNKFKIELFKQYFYGYYKYSEVVQLVLNLVEKNDQFQSLEKLVHWCFTKRRDSTKFKNFILVPDVKSVCLSLLSKGALKLADEFVGWCCDSSRTRVCKYKNKLMLHECIENLFNQLKYEEEMTKNIIKWFNPSKIVKTRFSKKFKDLWWIWSYVPVI